MKNLYLRLTGLLAVILFFGINMVPQAYCEMSYEVCSPEDLSGVTLRLFYESEKISGYLIFYDCQARICSLDSGLIPLLTYGDWQEPLEIISPGRFKLLTLNNGGKIFAFPIKAIPFSLPQNSSVKITFRLGQIQAIDQVSNYSHAELKKDLYQLPILYQDRKSKKTKQLK
ncbi:hypothetical protein D4R78_08170 [bacterium]|nr:MAG: hypothetical protein D4R78_08170 [bacterium]